MTEKNKKKQESKKRRNLWPLNPVTRIKNSSKGYNRARDRKDKDLYKGE